MTLTQLQYTLAVAEYGNFTLAAEKSFVTQPTLSMQVQKLEDELGVKLFNRNTKPIALTEIGSKIIEQAKIVVEEATRMKDIVATEKGVVGGAFKLGIIPTVMPTLLPMFLKIFVKKYPKVDLKIEELNTAAIIEKVSTGKLDAGIAATPINVSHIVERPLYYEPFVGYIPQEHNLSKLEQLTIEDLEMLPVLVLEDGHCFREHVLNLCQMKNSLAPGFDIKSGSFETLIHLADEGLGMTLLPYLHTLHIDRDKKSNLRFFKAPEPAREISLIHTKSQLKMPVIEALSDSIEGVLRGAIRFDDIKIITQAKQGV